MSRANRKPKPKTDRARLEALRDRLAEIIDSPETSPRDVIAASREYRITVAALGQSEPAAAGSKLDEIAARRRRRAAR
ncbi:hypothetical protein KN246_14715 [Mycobacterium intracellulare]|uniref:hypothetical protein n=1 Tax=Mycobacterium intracellulare TaxID=1767 RepID=UPI0007EB85BD|nr:hypothetical protein [Mycobacterium intracellulare]OBG17177.1 hypothetical protein A5769_15090 [Mycobacterium intracellulare]UGT99321.1 hypothetical protein LTQ55_12635 [Mycobacterium intracellulare]UGU08764.1 hypothetical protein LTQ56_09085 [Mycobacterium intracellulare subsp. intracellulare]UQB95538.1 hypothetical protein KN246_14715 [Mycobacterium intracellulare]BCO57890.1 hypothetical protein MINTM005_31340 [Mycobacterium intracellulare]